MRTKLEMLTTLDHHIDAFRFCENTIEVQSVNGLAYGYMMALCHAGVLDSEEVRFYTRVIIEKRVAAITANWPLVG